MKRYFVASLLAFVIAIAGCTGISTEKAVDGQVSIANNYYEFEQAAYEQAVSEGKYIFLDFHADWCSICRTEAPSIKAAFNEIENDNLIGFQVNYNDGRTSGDERALAKKYGVPYQHTKVIISPQGEVLSRDYRGPSSKQVIRSQIEEIVQA